MLPVAPTTNNFIVRPFFRTQLEHPSLRQSPAGRSPGHGKSRRKLIAIWSGYEN